ncbi:hypothetical protein [Methyloglobulus sp.]|uniref:hypothetical protein n=1 Tax=Methyloglobulus sp. TaxID=2518622 RepID=UPI0032B7251A
MCHDRLQAEPDSDSNDDLLAAINILNQMNEDGRHKLPANVPIDFIPQKMKAMVMQGKKLNKAAWECALMTAVCDQIKSGNLSVKHSKRFATLDAFFIPYPEWADKREAFFARAGLPANPNEVEEYLTKRLNKAYDDFLQGLPQNSYVQVDEKGWQVSSDPSEKLDSGTYSRLDSLHAWLGKHMRTIKLPDLLIEVDNELQFSRQFMPSADKERPGAQQVCEVLALQVFKQGWRELTDIAVPCHYPVKGIVVLAIQI